MEVRFNNFFDSLWMINSWTIQSEFSPKTTVGKLFTQIEKLESPSWCNRGFWIKIGDSHAQLVKYQQHLCHLMT